MHSLIFRSLSVVFAFLLMYMDFTAQYWVTVVNAGELQTNSGKDGGYYASGMTSVMGEDGKIQGPDGQAIEIDPYGLFGFDSSQGAPWTDLESTYGNDSKLETMANEEREGATSSPSTGAEDMWSMMLESAKKSNPDQEHDAALQTSWEMLSAMDTRTPSCSGATGQDSTTVTTCNKPMPPQSDSCTASRQWATESEEREIDVWWRMTRWVGNRYGEYRVGVPEFGLEGGAYCDTGSERQHRDYVNCANAVTNKIKSLIKKGLNAEYDEDMPGKTESIIFSVGLNEIGWNGGGWYSTYNDTAKVLLIRLTEDNWRTQECLTKLEDFREGLNQGYAHGDLQCTREQPLLSNGCASFEGVPVCEGQRPLPPEIDDQNFNCTEVAFSGYYEATDMPSFGDDENCDIISKDQTCSLNGTGECQEYYPDGTCAYYENEYLCGYDNSTDNCALQQEDLDIFPECSTNYESESTTDSYLLSDQKSCEVIHTLSTCEVKRTINLDNTYSDQEYPSEPENSPCLKEDDTFTKVTWTCNQRMPTAPAPGTFEPLYPGDDGSCLDATAEYDTNFFKTQGESWDLNTCDELEVQGCALTQGPTCVPGSTSSENGFCYVDEYDYECGEEVQVTTTDVKREYDCGQAMSCMGNDCIDNTGESGMSDFSQAVAVTQVMEAFSGDAQCDPENPGSCVIFNGDFMWCKNVLGGAQNCCDGPSGPSLSDYITMLRAGRKSLEGLQNIESFNKLSQPITGGWNYLKEGATQVYDSATKPVMQTWDKVSNRLFTSAPENVEAITSTADSGLQVAGEAGSGATEAGSQGFIAGVKQKVANTSADFLAENFGEAAKEAFFGQPDAAGNYSLGGEGAFMGNALNFIMAAYMYYAIAMMIIQVVWKCEEIEFELAAKKDLRVCRKIGSWCEQDGGVGCIEKREGYCCFSSPLSRIMNEQIRLQTSEPWGEAESPNCAGIPVETLENIDWTKIDLSEWVAILSSTGNMPSPDVQEMMDQYSTDALTGSSSTIANEQNRAQVSDRTIERLNETNPSSLEGDFNDGLWQQVERNNDN